MTVYTEGDLATHIFIVYKGEFEMAKRLPKSDKVLDNANLNHISKQNRIRYQNILAQRLPEIKDIPFEMKLSIFGRGSLIGEEDIFSRQMYSTTLKCYSSKGTLFRLPKEQFQLLKTSELSWLSIMEKIIHKESRQ